MTNKVEKIQEIFEFFSKTEFEESVQSNLLLHEAVKNSNTPALEFLIRNVDPILLSCKDEFGKTALHLAVEQKCLPACKLLFTTEVLKQKDKTGNTPFHNIVRDNFIACFDEAMKYVDKSVVKGINNKNETPLHIAAKNANDGTILLKLIEAGSRVDAITPKGNTLLHFAAEKGSDISVKILLDFVGVSQRQSLLNAQNKEGQTAFILAAKNGFTECCKQMQGANVNHQDKTGSTALHYACSCSSNRALSCVQHLISNNSDTSIKDNNKHTALYKAATKNNCDSLSFLLKSKENFEEEFDEILSKVSSKKCFRCINELLNREEVKKLINKPDSEGNTHLHMAIKDRGYVLIEVLLQMGKNISIANNDNEYPLHIAATFLKGNSKACQLFKRVLDESGPFVNSCSKNGDSPLHYAVRSGNIEAVRALLAKNGQLFKRNKNELNCLQIAAVEGQTLILQEIVLKFKKGKRRTEILQGKPHLLHLASKFGHLDCCEVIVAELKVCFRWAINDQCESFFNISIYYNMIILVIK